MAYSGMCIMPIFDLERVQCSNCDNIQKRLEIHDTKCSCCVNSKWIPVLELHCSNCKILKTHYQIYVETGYEIKCSCSINAKWIGDKTPISNYIN